jgi:hypothetical protein
VFLYGNKTPALEITMSPKKESSKKRRQQLQTDIVVVCHFDRPPEDKKDIEKDWLVECATKSNERTRVTLLLTQGETDAATAKKYLELDALYPASTRNTRENRQRMRVGFAYAHPVLESDKTENYHDISAAPDSIKQKMQSFFTEKQIKTLTEKEAEIYVLKKRVELKK